MNKIWTFVNPGTGKQWWIEVKDNRIRTCLNRGKMREIVCEDDYRTRSKASSEMMAKMGKGFIYQNPEAGLGEVKAHQFVGRSYSGFMPIAASADREDFFITRTVGDFEDEILYHFDEDGSISSRTSMGAKRMTYEQVLCSNQTILMNNSYLIERFSIENGRIEPFAGKKDSMKSMLDAKGQLGMWYTGEEIVVFDFERDCQLWQEKVECKKTEQTFATYYCFGMLSPKQTKMVYRTEERGYAIVDLKSGTKTMVENSGWHPFFSPDDEYFSVGGKFYACVGGEEVSNPFPFTIKDEITYYDICTVKTGGSLMAIQQEDGRAPIEIWDYVTRQKLAKIDDIFIVKGAAFDFTKSNLVLHTDYGVVSVYNLNI